MNTIRYVIKTSTLAILAVLLPASLMATPIIVRINDTPSDQAVIQVIGAPEGWSVVPDEVDSALVESGIITLHGVDQDGLVPELGWRFVIPNAPDPNRSAVDIVWIQHEWWGDNSLQIAFDSNKTGYYRNPEIVGDLNAGVVTDNWVTLYADDVVVVQYKPHTYRLRN